MVTDGDTLSELSQAGIPYPGSQFWLTNEDYLQEVIFTGLQVGKHPDLFKRRQGKVLSLVNDKQGATTSGIPFYEKGIEFFEVPGFIKGIRLQFKFKHYLFNKIIGGQVGIGQHCRFHGRISVRQQPADKSCLANAYLAGEENKSDVLAQAILQISQGHSMFGAGV